MPEKKEWSTVVAKPVEQRVTVNLTPPAVRAMNNLIGWTGNTKTDTINRALQIYEFIEQVMQNGASVHVRQTKGAELERLIFTS